VIDFKHFQGTLNTKSHLLPKNKKQLTLPIRYHIHTHACVISFTKTFYYCQKALKNAEKKAIEALKSIKKNVAITKSRKPFWYAILPAYDSKQFE
jgi:hypothetical protein